jgi:hypothetical protein
MLQLDVIDEYRHRHGYGKFLVTKRLLSEHRAEKSLLLEIATEDTLEIPARFMPVLESITAIEQSVGF